MANMNIEPVDEEITFGQDEIIVSKTDLKGRITYVNDIFCKVAEMKEREVLGEPHSIIRHPDMPRAVFQLLWETIQHKKEIFAYVKNISKTGKYYWVLAHVTPTMDDQGNIVAYHSNRRSVSANEVQKIDKLYKEIAAVERQHANRKEGMLAGAKYLAEQAANSATSYDEFIWSVGA
ncbi:PAS domain-containing protein [Emcibacter nanhaiensis]|uniref:PAS domain S-box protein n=1 Tax=Emcibacter nanhaiensis TaxID=1505037 RepID=A0A501PS27_9PROT|nr:PAS domain-containing protein [Emcibacter nanhaiensis]TPD62764.1 PAS domain S-box protein [Emcibacter nanhaiensis]